MQLVFTQSTDPAFNLGLEEYLLRETKDSYLILWRDEPSIIVGRHQLTSKELNHEYVFQHLIPVVRRISGGGTVFHDHGNLNYTFIDNVSENREIDYNRFCQPIIETLRKLGVQAELSGKSDICIGDAKISGTAIYMYHNRILHHGTLLFDSDLDILRLVLRAPYMRYTSRAIDSRRMHVTNISQHMQRKMSFEEFFANMASELKKRFQAEVWTPTPESMKAAFELKEKRYANPDWTFGQNPNGVYEYRHNLGLINARCHLSLQKGIIDAAGIYIEGNPEASTNLETLIQGEYHDYERIRDKLLSFDFLKELENVTIQDVLQLLF